MKIVCKMITILAALILASTIAIARESEIDALAAISHEITFINSFGSWQDGIRQGHYRLIIIEATKAPGHSKVYLQWVEEKPDTTGGIIYRVVPVIEINDAGVYKILETNIATESDGSNVVELVAVNQYSKASNNIRLVMGNAGQYEFEYISKPYSSAVDNAVNAIPLQLDKYARPSF